MLDRSQWAVVVLALVVGVAGGGAAATMLDGDASGSPDPLSDDANGTDTTDRDADAQSATRSTRTAAPDATVTDPERSGPIATLPAPGSAYADLYNRTIDSVVTIRARTARGGSQGSGFVYDSQGHIVTNEHVVGGAETALVRFSDGTFREATVVGTDVYTDLAVLEVGTVPAYVDPLPVAARNPVPGRRVAALGSPFGLEGSITSGIVSGVNRSMDTRRGFAIPATVQTDAPINPGNSGGPLVSLNGTVVGVNRAKRGDNVGYAISPQLVTRVVPELIADGSYDHSFMGIRTIPVTPRVATANGLDRARGALVTGVLDGGPSDGSLQPARSRTTVDGRRVPTGGDVILRIDGRPISSQQQLTRVLMLHTRPGETVPVTVFRDGSRRRVQVTLGERPEPTA